MKPEIVLELKDLHKSFGTNVVHSGVNLELHRGELLGLFGGSGEGKSVLIRSIIGLETPDSGEIWYQGEDLTKKSEVQLHPIRKKIGFVFQNGALFDSLSVAENLSYPLRAHTKLTEKQIEEKVTAMLELIDMPNTQDLLPNELSGGMQKRAGLARAIILEPEVILFDEPTAGLDPINTKRFIANLTRLKKRGMTGILVTHDIQAAFDLCDRISILRNGVIHTIDTVENIKNSKDPFVESFIQGAFVQ